MSFDEDVKPPNLTLSFRLKVFNPHLHFAVVALVKDIFTPRMLIPFQKKSSTATKC